MVDAHISLKKKHSYHISEAAAASVLYGIFTTPSGLIFTFSLV
jgi:hypothetical protein